MSSEIKFRAWDKNQQRMGVCLTLSLYDGEITGSDIDFGESISVQLIADESIVFMQYTGLKDKNGIEIYEGDIIRYDGGNYDEISEVKFSMGAFYIGSSIPGGLLCRISVPEIIGNVWEHPHLLEQSS